MKSKNRYSLPFHKKDLILAASDPKAHFGHFKDAIDFVLPIDSELLCCADGSIVDVQTKFKSGGNDPKYELKVNYVTIKHKNNEFSQYAHLKYKGCIKRIGDKVKKEELIGYSGNTGRSTSPHLHFQVLVLDKTPVGFHTLEPRFDEKIRIIKEPQLIKKRLNT